MRAAIYIRLSEETDRTTSPQRQRADCHQIVRQHGWTHQPDDDLYEDLDISAYSGVARPGFDRLMAALDQYDVLVVWKLDRVYRRFTGFVKLIERLQQADVRLVSVNDTLDTSTPIGQAIAGFLAAQAETESANAGIRIRSAQQHLARTGRWSGGRIPYGWQPADHPDGGRQLILHPEQARVVRQIIGWLEQGMSGRQVAERLNTAGVPSPTGSPWSGQGVYYMVRSPRMAGWVRHRGEIVRGDDGQPVAGPEPMVDPERWQTLVDRLAGAGWDTTRRTGATLLSGLVRCGLCGGPMAGWTSDHPRAAYACSKKADHGSGFCRGVSIKRDWLDTYVSAAVVEAAGRWAHKIPAPTVTPVDDPVAPLVAQLRRLERDRTELGLYDDPESEQVYVSRWRELRRQIADARRAHDGRMSRTSRPSPADVVPDQVAEVWETLPTDARRQVVRALVDRVEVGPVRDGWRGKWDPERVQIVWL